VNCPVLALNGSLDVQVSSIENLAGIQKSLENGMCKQFKLQEIEGLNHLFQETQTGAVSEYAKIEQTLSDKMFAVLDPWLEKLKCY
jgi:surfactin synthase thioesterase subunit